jgi:hypothetical protein
VAALPVLFAVLFWVAVFLIFFTAQNSTPGEFLFGRFETPPPDLGKWTEVPPASGTERDVEGGLVREERLLLPNGQAGARYLLLQARYRDRVNRAIVRVEPERRIRRRRVSAR